MRGNPGQRRGGRYTKRFKRWCQAQALHPDVKRAFRKIRRKAARSGDARDLRDWLNMMTKYGFHELVQTRDVKLTSGKEILDTLDEALTDDE